MDKVKKQNNAIFNIRKFRRLYKLSRAQMAPLIPCDVSTLGRWENGTSSISGAFQVLLLQLRDKLRARENGGEVN